MLDEDYQYMLTYSCFEAIEYVDSKTKRPISMHELQMKASLPEQGYLDSIDDQVKKWAEEHLNGTDSK